MQPRSETVRLKTYDKKVERINERKQTSAILHTQLNSTDITDACVWHLQVRIVIIYYHKQTISRYDFFLSVSGTRQIGSKIGYIESAEQSRTAEQNKISKLTVKLQIISTEHDCRM